MLAQFHRQNLNELDLTSQPEIVRAIGALLGYLKRTQRTGIERMNGIDLYTGAQFMHLDLNARRNLELLETMRNKEKRGSLLWVLDKTHTAMGKRLIRSWIEQPLLSPAHISRRLNAVEELTQDSILRGSIAEQLTGIHDLERLMSRIVYGSANGRELRSLSSALMRLPKLKDLLKSVKSNLLTGVYEDIDVLDDVYSWLKKPLWKNLRFLFVKAV